MMTYSAQLLCDFLDSLVTFDNTTAALFREHTLRLSSYDDKKDEPWEQIRGQLTANISTHNSAAAAICSAYQQSVESVSRSDMQNKAASLERLQKCKLALEIIDGALRKCKPVLERLSRARSPQTSRRENAQIEQAPSATADETPVKKAQTSYATFPELPANETQAPPMTVDETPVKKVQTSYATLPELPANETQAPFTTADEILTNIIGVVSIAAVAQTALYDSNREVISDECLKLTCARELLTQEEKHLKEQITGNMDKLHARYRLAGQKADEKLSDHWRSVQETLSSFERQFQKRRKDDETSDESVYRSSLAELERELRQAEEAFLARFPPQNFLSEYKRIRSVEPSYTHFQSRDEIPRNLLIASLDYDLSGLNLTPHALTFLDRHYYFLRRYDFSNLHNHIFFPYSISFQDDFNWLFRFQESARNRVVEDARMLGMRLFMMFPPRKLNFTFIDPVKLGESFAMFNRLVSVDDRTNEVINGKVWFDQKDIEEKLKLLTNHISNVTQRCLQGKYDNIYEYNLVAEQNAEAYHVLMLMDYPEGLSEHSLAYLEQIATSGPKCGVFTLIYRNESQMRKLTNRSEPLAANLEPHFQTFSYSDDGCAISRLKSRAENRNFELLHIAPPSSAQLDDIIGVLKERIRGAEKVMIGVDRIRHMNSVERTNTTAHGIRIPIGFHGANETQYLTLGVDASQHALIAGLTRMGKSSLLHTIIMNALDQYRSPDELLIYLIDFKRGVEFQIYAEYLLPMFKVIAIETEREFGYNILRTIDRELELRARRFKKTGVDKIEEYRDLPPEQNSEKMPRILLIMDEFQELLSNTGDNIGRDSVFLLDRLVRTGGAFGVHLMLSSQSYANIPGGLKVIFDQMRVRIALKCADSDATMLLERGKEEIALIPSDVPGRAIYNSEAGALNYTNHFQVLYYEPKAQRAKLEELSVNPDELREIPTRIMLSSIEYNKFSFFNRAEKLPAKAVRDKGELYVGEALKLKANLNMVLPRTEYSNLLLCGPDSDKARSMTAFAMLSLALNDWILHNHSTEKPKAPFIYLMNYKPLRDEGFVDALDFLAKRIGGYIRNVSVRSSDEVQSAVEELYHATENGASETDLYLFVFGYQRAFDLRSEKKKQERQSMFAMMSGKPRSSELSVREMMDVILTNGPQSGVHTIIWQDSFRALDTMDRELIAKFYQRIAFNLSSEEFTQFIGFNASDQLGVSNAVYDNRAEDLQIFRPYQTPDSAWLEALCKKMPS